MILSEVRKLLAKKETTVYLWVACTHYQLKAIRTSRTVALRLLKGTPGNLEAQASFDQARNILHLGTGAHS